MRLRRRFRGGKNNGNSIKTAGKVSTELPQILLVGNPNVGKSLIFGRLTGAYVTVSNYPGTTVAIDEGKCKLGGRDYKIIDSPGMYSLIPITEEEKIGKKLMFEHKPALVLHVIDGKNIERMLPMTLQLIETGLPLMLVINMIDEAESMGITIDCYDIEQSLGIPVVPVSATTCQGFPELILRMGEYVCR